jgi:hypothetical protein
MVEFCLFWMVWTSEVDTLLLGITASGSFPYGFCLKNFLHLLHFNVQSLMLKSHSLIIEREQNISSADPKHNINPYYKNQCLWVR